MASPRRWTHDEKTLLIELKATYGWGQISAIYSLHPTTIRTIIKRECAARGIDVPKIHKPKPEKPPVIQRHADQARPKSIAGVADGVILTWVSKIERDIGRHGLTEEETAARTGVNVETIAAICDEFDIYPPKYPEPLEYRHTCTARWCRRVFVTREKGKFRCDAAECQRELRMVA